ncbi:hypothetical protein SCLCIDRAFT_103605 [Scleroderma citrinum Foug A]|uniref:Uncharacterized protein n=1 Tax=Scleroderma citrinum Foug A TaxID=1036808 RepID=A0A0C3EME1_9AGAM|nr:hypothetical protein SCLCIDRAFT_103605 [Scleroderma citrinum Foug A]
MIHVKWDKEMLHFPIPPSDTTLGKLRADIAEYTQLPPESFKLIHAGAVMKDDQALLSAYKIRENSTIALIGGHIAPQAPAPYQPSSKVKEPPTEESIIGAIRAELVRVRATLVPDVDAFVLACSNPLASLETAQDINLSKVPTSIDHTRLSELLLQSLLRLDALHSPGADWPDARQQRKAAVREVQGVLDRLDSAWSSR